MSIRSESITLARSVAMYPPGTIASSQLMRPGSRYGLASFPMAPRAPSAPPRPKNDFFPSTSRYSNPFSSFVIRNAWSRYSGSM